jgi:hypothetical protein
MDSTHRPSAADVRALRDLCELVVRPTSRAWLKARGYDWTRYPRLLDALDALDPLVEPSVVGGCMRNFLEAAFEALNGQAGRGTTLTGLQVVRTHLIDGHSWDAIVTEQSERGFPVSERTLRNRQNEALGLILEWAQAKQNAREVLDRAPTRARRNPRILVLLSVVALMMAIVWSLGLRSGSFGRPEPRLGLPLAFSEKLTHLPAPYAPWPLPEVDGTTGAMLVVRGADFRPRLLVSVRAPGRESGALVLWDPMLERRDWTFRFEPEPDEVRMREGMEPSTEVELYWADQLFYGNESSNLGATVAVVFAQKDSPTFVTEIDIASGREVGRYGHPGRFETGAVLDLDGDGQLELLVGGQDNVLDAPVAALLRPGDLHGNASTVGGPRGTRREDALVRVVLPSVPALENYWETDRLQVMMLQGSIWSPRSGKLSIPVGRDNYLIAYHAHLDARLRPWGDAPITLGDDARREWQKAGIDMDSTLARIRQEFVVLEDRNPEGPSRP